ncbi:hypothetical protein J5N14_07710 [Acinetobacter soli]|nr:hypothetical protein [Acinetobacter soli]
MSDVEYRVSSQEQSFVSTTDRKGLSKRINTPAEENLRVDLNWISLEVEDEGD